MDRDVPRVAFWVSSFEPEMEALAAEVACLRGAFPGSVSWGISPRTWGRLSWRRGFSVHPRMHLLFRAATRYAQRAFDINHVFGGLGDWFHLKAVRKRPTVLTVALATPPCDRALLGKIDRFVVEWPGAEEQLRSLGIGEERTCVIYPPVDVARFRCEPAGASDFTVLFASSPERADWLHARGVHLILDTARQRPEMKFRLVWRPWGDSLATVERWIRERGLTNVELLTGRFDDMQMRFQEAHVTLAPFTDMERCKAAPNSILESLACGRPVVLTRQVGLASLVEEARAGVVCAANPESLSAALDHVQADFQAYSRRARRLAEENFSIERFIQAYKRLYEEVA